MTARYEPPEEVVPLTKEDIHRRYQDAALVIFKEQQSSVKDTNYLTFGSSRRTMEYSSYGNQPVIIRRPAEALKRTGTNVSSQILRISRKPHDSCLIS